MSASLNLGCMTCKEYIWIGQYGFGKGHLYTEDKEIMELLTNFLLKHQNGSINVVDNEIEFDNENNTHKLLFVSEHSICFGDFNWKELK